MVRRALTLLAVAALAGAADAARDQGPCPDGFFHAFDGYRSCALDANPRGEKLSGDDLLWTDCGALCGPAASASRCTWRPSAGSTRMPASTVHRGRS